MEQILDISRQDFAGAKAAFEERDFRLMNILANRLMSNVLFANKDEKLFALPGFFLKDMALDFITSRDETGVNDLYKIAKASIAKVEDSLKGNFDLATFWSAYFKYWNDMRKVNVSSTERKAYKDNIAFTSNAISFLSKELFEGESVFLEGSLVVKGFLQEMDRIIR